MDENLVQKYRTEAMESISRSMAISSGRYVSAERNQGSCEALCALAGMFFATLNGVPYLAEGIPSELAEAAYGGLVKWKEQWDLRQ